METAKTALGFDCPIDPTGQRSRPVLASVEADKSHRQPVLASHAEQLGLFAVCPLNHLMILRGVVARYAGTGQWRVDWLDGSSDSLYLGELLVPANMQFACHVRLMATDFPGSVLPEPDPDTVLAVPPVSGSPHSPVCSVTSAPKQDGNAAPFRGCGDLVSTGK